MASAAAIARVDQLECAGRSDEADRGQFEQPCAVVHLHLFEFEAIALQRPEHLLDAPARAIRADDAGGVGETVDGPRGQ